MVGQGEVDDDLQPEVQAECSKFGEVSKCLIFEVIASAYICTCCNEKFLLRGVRSLRELVCHLVSMVT